MVLCLGYSFNLSHKVFDLKYTEMREMQMLEFIPYNEVLANVSYWLSVVADFILETIVKIEISIFWL